MNMDLSTIATFANEDSDAENYPNTIIIMDKSVAADSHDDATPSQRVEALQVTYVTDLINSAFVAESDDLDEKTWEAEQVGRLFFTNCLSFRHYCTYVENKIANYNESMKFTRKDKFIDFDSPASPAARAAVAWIIDEDPQNIFRKMYDDSKSRQRSDEVKHEEISAPVSKMARAKSVPHLKKYGSGLTTADLSRHSLSFTNDDFQYHSTIRAVSSNKRKLRPNTGGSIQSLSPSTETSLFSPKKHEFLRRSTNPQLKRVTPKKTENENRKVDGERQTKNNESDISNYAVKEQVARSK